MPNFLFVSDKFIPVTDGTGTTYDKICKSLGEDVVVLTSSALGVSKQSLTEFDNACGYRVERISSIGPTESERGNSFQAFLTRAVNKIRTLSKVTKIRFQYHPHTLIIGEAESLGWLSKFARYILGMKLVIFAHGKNIDQASKGKSPDAMRGGLEKAHLIISDNAFTKSKIIQKFNFSPNRIIAVNEDADTDDLSLSGDERRIDVLTMAINNVHENQYVDTPSPREYWAEKWCDAEKSDNGKGVQFIVTVDVEECFDWEKPTVSPSHVPPFQSFKAFHNRMVAAGVKPLYLLTYKMMSNEIYVQHIRVWMEEGQCDLGIHMHSWETPPDWGPKDSYFSYQGNLPKHVEREKLMAISSLFKEAFGCPPKYHRAGIYGIGRNTLGILAELDINVDLSPSSKFNFTSNGGPDFRNFSNKPFFYGSSEPVLCLPVTSENFLRGPAEWVTKYITLPSKSRFSVPVRFSPEGNPVKRLSFICEKFAKDPNIIPIISLHSSSLVEFGSPYSLTTLDAENNIECLFKLIDLMQDNFGYKAATIDDVVNSYECSAQ